MKQQSVRILISIVLHNAFLIFFSNFQRVRNNIDRKDQLQVPKGRRQASSNNSYLLFHVHSRKMCRFCRVVSADNSARLRGNCYLLIFHQLFSASVSTLEQCEAKVMQFLLHMKFTHKACAPSTRHNRIRPSRRSSSHLRCATSLATSWLCYFFSCALDVNKINLLLLQPHRAINLRLLHIFYRLLILPFFIT